MHSIYLRHIVAVLALTRKGSFREGIGLIEMLVSQGGNERPGVHLESPASSATTIGVMKLSSYKSLHGLRLIGPEAVEIQPEILSLCSLDYGIGLGRVNIFWNPA